MRRLRLLRLLMVLLAATTTLEMLLLLTTMTTTVIGRLIRNGVCGGIIVAPPRLPAIASGARPPLTGRAGDRRHRRQWAARRIARTARQRDHQLAGAGMVAMLAQPDALPGAQRQFALADRYCQRAAQEAGFDVRRLSVDVAGGAKQNDNISIP